MNRKANAHYHKTDMAIRELVIELLREKNLNQISVTEICQQIGINRSTFYAHFCDVYEVVEKTEYAMAEEMGKRFSDKLKSSRKDAFLEIFHFVYEHKRFYEVYLQQGKRIHFLNETSFQKFLDLETPLVEKLAFLSEVDYHYHVEYFRAGINALLRCWLERDCQESPEKLLSILAQEYQMYQIVDSSV